MENPSTSLALLGETIKYFGILIAACPMQTTENLACKAP
jgi:hypothetical protein